MSSIPNKFSKELVKKRVAVGLSGGVDSSVAAYLLKKQGYNVTGVFMQCWESKADGCKADEDKKFAVETAAVLGIPFEHLDFIKEYKEKVISYFYDEYKAGRTPNPDVMCNKEIKFGMFFNWAVENKFDYVATGHYARIQPVSEALFDKFLLLKGVDDSKDQSYFLYVLGQKELSKTLFPVGDLHKSEVRKIAENAHLPSAKRPDSTGICFIGEVDIKNFLKERIAPKKGAVLRVNGEVIGTHDGAWFYTIGQRHGFNLSKYFGTPLYVVKKDVEKNEIVVGSEADASLDKFEVENLTWIADDPGDAFKCDVRIRHLGKLYKASVKLAESAVATKKTTPKLAVSLDIKAFGVAPGQSAVFYKKDLVLGGGIIC